MISKNKQVFSYHLSLFTVHFSSASDEVDNLDAVAFVESGLRPVGAANDVAIVFDGETFGCERELFDEIVERRARLNFAAFPVDFDTQRFL